MRRAREVARRLVDADPRATCAPASSAGGARSSAGRTSSTAPSSRATSAAARSAIPTANLALGADLLVPPYGIYAGFARGHRAAISIGVNPHYGGHERRIEPHLLDFDGDLYGERLVLELWQYLREERAFASEEELVAQIGRDVEDDAQRHERPA